MSNFNITIGGKELLDRVRPLWEELNTFHVGIGKSFSGDIAKRTFDMRKNDLIEGSSMMHVLIASKESDVAYCICTINNDGKGEIDSLYVKKEHRSKGLGRKLAESAIQWLKENNVNKKAVVVLEGNAEALEFYQYLGFLPRNIELEYMD
jgi:GNAT superfamily N-acetyltransferase